MDLQNKYKENTFEIRAVKLQIKSTKIILLGSYRALSGYLNHVFDLLDDTLEQLEQKSVELLFCGDKNLNYFIENHKRTQLQSLMNTYNLIQVIEFYCKTKSLLIDNIFLDKRGHGSYTIYPARNGLSDPEESANSNSKHYL